jgi:hypothetical protein
MEKRPIIVNESKDYFLIFIAVRNGEYFMKYLIFVLVCLFGILGAACEADDAPHGNSDGDSDADTDSDTDSDSDTDADNDADSDSDGDTGTGVPSGEGCSAMDILFVIDDSGSMSEEQTNLINNFPKFIEVLDNYKTSADTQLEYRVGVTTTGVTRNFTQNIFGMPMPMNSVGPDGALQGQQKCGLAAPWIDGPGATVETQFSCAANVGTTGSGTEMPFAALEGALGKKSEPGKVNEGFYRKNENSLLVVVIITDEDDCSIENGGVMKISLTGGSDCNENTSKKLYTVQGIKDFLDDKTGGPGRYVVVGIAGPKSCSSQFGSAANAKRVKNLVDMCADYGVFGDICAGDLWTSLQTALETMKVTCDDMPPPV